jgi:mono/diheme cytochrome c family protein
MYGLFSRCIWEDKQLMKSGMVAFALLIAVVVMAALQVPFAQQGSPADMKEAGHKIFVERCAKCHDENGAKVLPDGTSLVQRLARSKDPSELLATRLKNEQERRAVMLYLQPMLPDKRSSR